VTRVTSLHWQINLYGNWNSRVRYVEIKTMLAKKIIMGLVLLAMATTIATTGASANAPGGAYVQCGGPSSPVRCTPDSW